MNAAQQKKSPSKTLKDINGKVFARLVKFIFSKNKRSLILVFACIIVNSLSSTAATFFLQSLVDSCIVPGIKSGLLSVLPEIVRILTLTAAIYVAGIITSFLYTRIMACVTQKTLRSLRDSMFKKMQTLPLKYFDTHPRGSVMSTYTNDVDAIRQVIGMSIPSLMQSFLSLCAMGFMMIYYSVPLSVVTVLFLFLMSGITKKIALHNSRFMAAQQKSLSEEEGFAEEMIQGQKAVQVFRHEDANIKTFDELNQKLFKDGEKANIYGNILGPILNNVGNLMYVLLAVTGALMIHFKVYNISLSASSIVTAGIIIAFLNTARQVSQTVGQISNQISMIAMGVAGAERVFSLIDQETEFDAGYVKLVNAKTSKDGIIQESEKNTGFWAWKHPHSADGSVTYTELKGDVVLENVDFGYTKEKTVLHGINIHALPGQKIAFVGSTGAGKTTITNLINRFYDIQDGKIRYDGININKINKYDLRRSLGMVLQDVNLFTGTVLENIRYGRLDATDEECIQAAKLSNAHSFISRLPQGYDTMISSNGGSLSQGQRQLISIARAAVANPPVMILDEATSSIDTRTESLVSKGMDNLMKGRTVFVIAHRLSTVRNSDVIIVLDKGRIIEQGNHTELLNLKGTYWQLYTGAFELS